MPLSVFACTTCSHAQEHFIYSIDASLACPQCSSDTYVRNRFARVRADIWYSDKERMMATKVTPHINELYSKMGREMVDQDTKTAENIFGKDKVEQTFVQTDEV